MAGLRPAETELYLSEVSPQDKPWDIHRANAQAVQKLYAAAELSRYADRIQQCSTFLGFSLQAQDDGFKFRLQQSKFCRVRHCPVCQWRRSLMWRARFFQAVPRVMESHPKARWVFLTLTVRNCSVTDLKATLKDMNGAWKRLIQKRNWPAMGFVRSTEVTRSQNGEAHPHFHCLLLLPSTYFSGPNYLSQDKWRLLWQDALRVDYSPVVNVKAVKPKDGQIAKAVLETLKYGVKEDDLLADPDWLAELTTQLHKTRAVSVGGVIKPFLSEEEPDDLIHAEDEPVELGNDDISVWFGWREMVERYAKTDRK
jgi:plasmid rolling circle replication initiator protein Rep